MILPSSHINFSKPNSKNGLDKEFIFMDDMFFKDLPEGVDEYFAYLEKKWPCSEETLRTGIISEETRRMTEEARKTRENRK
jgi:hypothetical protein